MKPASSTPSVNTQIVPSSRVRRTSSASIQEKINAASTENHTVVSESILQSTGLSKVPALILAVKHCLCYSLLSNCTSSGNTVVTLSLKIFVPLIQNCRHHLKTEVEAFVTQAFFVLLDSKNTLVGTSLGGNFPRPSYTSRNMFEL
jgi:Sec7-like guanine-nucleotide exchange factor